MVAQITWDVSRLAGRLSDIEKKNLPFATALALTRCAQAARAEIVTEMGRVFDRPTPYTLRAPFVERAERRNLVARIVLRGSRVESAYLRPGIYGGPRALKSHERALVAAGLMPKGYFAVPAAGAPLNAYGNVPGGRLMRMMSDLRIAERWAGAQQNRTPRTTARKTSRAEQRFFVVRPDGRSHLAPGVWVAPYGKPWMVKPFLLFVPAANYTSRLDYQGVATRVTLLRFPDEFRTALATALATDRNRSR